MTFIGIVVWLLRAAFLTTLGYFLILALLAIPYLQNHVIYLHKVTLTWFHDTNEPEQWGFLHNQVTPFTLVTPDGETLHAWHILPLELYRRNEEQLLSEPSGLVSDLMSRQSFKLLRDDPEARLVLYFHGAAGTLGSGYRPASYRAISAGAPDKIHILAIDYRSFGRSTGSPSEQGLITDALTLADFAMSAAGIPADRIALFGQSLGTSVSIALAHRFVLQPRPTCFAGMVFVAAMADVETLTATYRLAGTVPLLGPVARFPWLLRFFNRLIVSKWPNKDRLAEVIRTCEGAQDGSTRYDITLIHAEDDYDIPWLHSEKLYWSAVNASNESRVSFEVLEKEKRRTRRLRGAGGWSVEHRTENGVVREQILRYGLHDMTMGYPVVSLAVLRAFESRDGSIKR